MSRHIASSAAGGAAASTKKALQLAKSILSTQTSKRAEKNQYFQELTQLLNSTNPPPFTPRTLSNVSTSSSAATTKQLQLFKKIESSAEGIAINYEENNKEENAATNRIYGTTPAETILTLLDVLYPNDDDDDKHSRPPTTRSFIDAGSGQGIPALAAALSNKFGVTKGIEYEPKWHQRALALQQAYYHHYDQEQEQQEQQQPCHLEYHCGDMTNTFFKGATCVFSNCVLFDAVLSQSFSARLEADLAGGQRDEEDVFVVTMSRRMALPSFDLVDVLSLEANDGLFTFYVNRKARTCTNNSISTTSFHATSDSEVMRSLRHGEGFAFHDLVEEALKTDAIIGMGFLIAVAASEPSIRYLGSNTALMTMLTASLDSSTSLQVQALGSMLLRAMVDHPTGRRSINESTDLVGRLIAFISDAEEHPAVRTNLLDVLGNLLHDKSLNVCHKLDTALAEILDTSGNDKYDHSLKEAAQEVMSMRLWWEGRQRSFPGVSS